MTENIFDNKQSNLSKLKIDVVKKNSLKTIFQTLMVLPSNRTIADLNTLSRILMTITPIKQMKDFSAIYCICKSMYLSKYKEKDFVYQKRDQSQARYIVLNGKIGLYRRCEDEYQNDEVVFMNLGSCFGQMYKWKQKFLPLALEQTLLAVIPHKQLFKIPFYLNIEKQMIAKQLQNAGIFPKHLISSISREDIHSASQLCSISHVPHGTYLIQEGEISKGMFYIVKGIVKKTSQITDAIQLIRPLKLAQYSAGSYFPENNLSDPVKFNLITQCPSQIITIPKKALKKVGYNFKNNEKEASKDNRYYLEQMKRQQEWKGFKESLVKQVLQDIQVSKNKKKVL